MYDKFVMWGQSYGFMVTCVILVIMCFMMSNENKMLKRTIESLRSELADSRKIIDKLGGDDLANIDG